MVKRMIDIDRVKLQNEIGKRGLTLSEVAREMGMSKNFMKTVVDRGTAAESTLVLLAKLYNIRFEDIAPKREQAQEVPTPDITLQVIEEGVYRAIARALPELEEAVCRAMRRALE